MDRIKQKKTMSVIREVVQLLFFVVFPSAFASAFSAVKDVFTAMHGSMPLTLTPFAKILIFLLVFTVFFGRFFCGYACAFGAVGDWVYQLSQLIQRKTGRKLPKISRNTQKILQCGKYFILGLIAVLCFLGYAETVNKNSPWTLFSMLRSGTLPGKEMAFAGVILVILIAGMAVQERFFCQFLCPLGAVFSLIPVLPTGVLRRDREKCIKGCNLCRRGCPVSLKLGEEEIREGECVRCNKCITYCPRESITECIPSGRAPARMMTLILAAAQAAVLLVVLKFVI